MNLSAEEIKTLDGYKQEQLALLDLINRPGWKLVVAQFKQAAAHAYNQMVSTDNAHAAAKHMGCFHAAENVHIWPDQRLKQLQHLVRIMELGPQGQR